MKKFLTIALVFTFMISSMFSVSQIATAANEDVSVIFATGRAGDVNGDNAVDSTDLALMKRYTLGIILDFPISNSYEAADLNRDGDINSTDMSVLKRFLLGQITSIPIGGSISTPTHTPYNPTPTPTPSQLPESNKFPYNAKYAFGNSSIAPDQAAANQLIKTEWESFKSTYITSSGAGGFKRVQRDNGSKYDTVSEGMGYGMVLAVYMDDQSIFDDLYGYVKKYFNNNGVMDWQINASGGVIGSGAATDADEDIAVALVFASKKWSSGKYNYANEARTLIGNIYRTMVENGTYVLKPGDKWGGSNVTNPSYFAPAWYRIFAQFTGNNEWNKVADKCYEIARNAMRNNSGTGLVPDWCRADGGQASGQSYDFKYDAVRYHWRIAIDYSWFGTSQAKSDCEAVSAFYKKEGVKTVVDGYTIQGNKVGQWHTATFTSMMAAASMPIADTAHCREAYNELVAKKDSGDYHYFGNSLRMMSLLYTTGNFPNLYK